MKKLLLGFGALTLLATGCTQLNVTFEPLMAHTHHYLVYATVDNNAQSVPRWVADGGQWSTDQPRLVRALLDLACIEIERVGGPAAFTCGEPFYSTYGGTKVSTYKQLLAGQPVEYHVQTGAYQVGIITLD